MFSGSGSVNLRIRQIFSAVQSNIGSAFLYFIAIVVPVTIFSGLISSKGGDLGLVFKDMIGYVRTGEFYRHTSIVTLSIITSVLAISAIRNKGIQQLKQMVSGREGRPLIWWFLLSVAIGLGVVITTNAGDLSFLSEQPGGVFDIFVGVLSVFGIYLTFTQVLGVSNSIVSFRDLINRVEDLIRDTDPSDTVFMMVLTPAMGCIALDEPDWKRVTQLITDENRRVSVTCLSIKAMEEWFLSYLHDGQNEKESDILKGRIQEGIATCKKILHDLDYNWRKEPIQKTVIANNMSEIPHSYMIANKARAIVAVPLALPTPEYTPPKSGTGFRRGNVQFIGFETKDFHLVESINEEIRARREFLRERQPPVTDTLTS